LAHQKPKQHDILTNFSTNFEGYNPYLEGGTSYIYPAHTFLKYFLKIQYKFSYEIIDIIITSKLLLINIKFILTSKKNGQIMSIYLIWFLIGSGFLIAEFVMPTFIMFFFALGAIIVSVVTAGFDLSINSQVILFALSSIISLLLLRNFMKHIFQGNESKGEDNYFDNTIDSNKNIGIVSKNIEPNSFGEIKYKGTFYRAQSDSLIDEGKNVRIVSKGDEESSFLKVEEIIN